MTNRTACRVGHPWGPGTFYTQPDGRQRCRQCLAAAKKTWWLTRGKKVRV